MKIQALEGLPGDFDRFAAEVAAGLSQLYGDAAGRTYLSVAHQALRSQIQHPDCMVLGASAHGELAAMLTGVLRGGRSEISFIHVRRPFQGQGVESALAQEALRTYRAGGTDGIICEMIPLCPLDLTACFTKADFTHVPRALMQSDCARFATEAPTHAVFPLTEADWPEAAACIVDAYKGHPGRTLHHEVRGILQSADFIARVAAGRYGPVIDGGLWGIRGARGLDGVLAGCSVAPGMGFMLQLGVRRTCQGQGIGTALLRHAARRFQEEGFPRAALGVTLDDPAQRLYEKLGFSILRPVDAYVWWRPGHAAAAEERI